MLLLFLIPSTSVGTDCDGFADFPGCPEATHETCQISAPSLLHTTSVEVFDALNLPKAHCRTFDIKQSTFAFHLDCNSAKVFAQRCGGWLVPAQVRKPMQQDRLQALQNSQWISSKGLWLGFV